MLIDILFYENKYNILLNWLNMSTHLTRILNIYGLQLKNSNMNYLTQIATSNKKKLLQISLCVFHVIDSYA